MLHGTLARETDRRENVVGGMGGLDPITHMTKLNLKGELKQTPPRPEWRIIVERALQDLDGEADLTALYAAVKKIAPTLAMQRSHWQAKVRQIVQRDPAIENVARGVWRLRSRRSSADHSTPSRKAA
jgi:hypothetical protein